MGSVIDGFAYDIFISYRQKDNKYDGWVTTFVDNLKRELEATFKEDISIYFDENPHDGLLDTHNVDKSLEGKLKCLVFIPVISQTYCDPKSFAWQHEFCVFNKLAQEDQFGRDIKLTGGNVASRILPVKINDLDPEDKTLLENELGGVLRCVEFIYKSAGVNRPLRANEDHPHDNLNKTYYRDQINKVANAVKEIIKGLKYPGEKAQIESTRVVEKEIGKRRIPLIKVAVPMVILTVILIAGLLILPPVIKKLSERSSAIGKSIAVLPFVNLSNDPEQEYFSDGMVDAILDRLFKVGDLNVTSRTSSMSYKNTKLTFKEIAHELGVSAILEGSVQKIGNNVRIIVQLIDTKTNTHLWSETYDRDLSDIFSIQSEIAQNVAQKMKAVIKPQIKNLIEKSPTSNIEAYEAYLQGVYYWRKLTQNDLGTAMKYFELAKEKDPEYALAYAGIGFVWLGLVQGGFALPTEARPKVNAALATALKIDSTLDQIHYMIIKNG
jgi:TolB-like protein